MKGDGRKNKQTNKQMSIHRASPPKLTRTIHEVARAHPAELRPVVDDALARAHEDVELHGAVVVDEADARERRLAPVGPDADHLAVEREVPARSSLTSKQTNLHDQC